MVSKILILALLPIIVIWVVAVAICKSVAPTIRSNSGVKNLSDAGCFDPTEALYEFI